MKKVVLIALSLIVCLSSFSQEDEMRIENEKNDTTNIRLRKKTIKIIEDEDDGETYIFVKRNRFHKPWTWRKKDDFRGSWSGFSFGYSNFVDSDFSLSRKANEKYMDLNTGKSWSFNINIAQYGIDLIGDKFGLVTGIGLEWSYYRFDNDNSIQKNPTTSVIEERILNPDWNIQKSKLSTTYAVVPLLLELHSSSYKSKSFVINAGLIGAVKLGSNTKVVYRSSGNKNKDKIRDDYNLSTFRYGVHARVGFNDCLLYATYYLSPLFEKNKGSKLYPISVGLAFSID